MQGQQPVIRQTDQAAILQQPGNIVIKMNEVQVPSTVGMSMFWVFMFMRVCVSACVFLFFVNKFNFNLMMDSGWILGALLSIFGFHSVFSIL